MIELERPIYSLDFLDLQFDIHHIEKKQGIDSKTYQLPNLGDYIESEKFCKVCIAYSEEGIFLQFISNKGFSLNDKIHIGIDTRDLKSALILHRFCHLFEVNILEKPNFFEKTRFRRADDAHELCLSSDLIVKREKGLKKESISLQIPSKCLHGFDPKRFDRIGFFYVIEKKLGSRQDFCMSNHVWDIMDTPNLWQTLNLR